MKREFVEQLLAKQITPDLQEKLNKKYTTRQEALDDWIDNVVQIQNHDGSIDLYYLREFYERIDKDPSVYFNLVPMEPFEYNLYFQYIKH